MRLLRSSILLITCFACLGFDLNLVSKATPTSSLKSSELAQASSIDAAQQSILQPGSAGTQVKTLQTSLKKLGYYKGEIDGRYGTDTSLAVSKFQEAKGLIADGVFGTITNQKLLAVVNAKSSTSGVISNSIQSTTQLKEKQDIVWWSLVCVGVLGSLGALLYILRGFSQVGKLTTFSERTHPDSTNSVMPAISEYNTTNDVHSKNASDISSSQMIAAPPSQLLPVEKTSRLAKVNIVDQLIEDLHSLDPTQRRKAIWDLGQQGDSRAIQPLVELMMNADTQQRSLILAALAEIGTRALKPMNRALAISLQDESPQVRTNAIRDLTRIYDMMAQVSQMLSHAVHDPDTEVQATARYALSQMNRIRTLPSQETEEKKELDLS